MAASEGRLSVEETDDRLARTFATRYRHELDALTADLPAPSAPSRGWGDVVATSGCLPDPQWTVLTGVSQDGMAYTWQASTYSEITSAAPSWVGHVKAQASGSCRRELTAKLTPALPRPW